MRKMVVNSISGEFTYYAYGDNQVMVVIVEHQSIADLTVHCNKLWGNCTSACYNRDCMWISDGCVCDGRAIKPSKGTQEEKITYYLEMAEVEFNEIKEVFFR